MKHAAPFDHELATCRAVLREHAELLRVRALEQELTSLEIAFDRRQFRRGLRIRIARIDRLAYAIGLPFQTIADTVRVAGELALSLHAGAEEVAHALESVQGDDLSLERARRAAETRKAS